MAYLLFACEVLDYATRTKMVMQNVVAIETKSNLGELDGVFGFMEGLSSMMVDRDSATAQLAWKPQEMSMDPGSPNYFVRDFDGTEPDEPGE